MHTEISSDTYYSVNTDDNHNACDTSDEDPQPAKRRKPRATPAVTPAICHRHTPELRLGVPSPLVALSATTPEIDDAQPQADDGFKRKSTPAAACHPNFEAHYQVPSMRVQENTRPLDKRRERGDIRDDRKGMLMGGDRSCFPADSGLQGRSSNSTIRSSSRVGGRPFGPGVF